MNSICPECKNKEIEIIYTKVDLVTYKCLNCNKEFNRAPTVQERDAFNN